MENEYERKKMFIKVLKAALVIDQDRSNVSGLDYEKRGYNEVITITYTNGRTAYINVSANSNGANLTEVVREVYGTGAHGRIMFDGEVWPERL